MASILYLDGEPYRREHFRTELMFLGFQVRAVTKPLEAERLMKYCLYDCVLARCANGEHADVAGFCSVAKNSANLTMVLMDVADISFEEHLLDCGVDDVVVGAQACPSLVAKRIKVRLHLARPRGFPGAIVRLNNVIADFDHRTVQRDGIKHQLPGILADLLQYFVCNADHVISRQELNESPIWADSICTPAAEGGKTFDVHVSRLRKIIEENSHEPALIQSVRGIGWKLTVRPVRYQGTLLMKPNSDTRADQLLLFT